MARAIEQLKQAMEVCELGALTLPDQIDALIDAARAILQEVSTLTPPNEPLTIEQLREMDGEPVWRGEWMGSGDGYADGELVYDTWECSHCGHVIDEEDDPDMLPQFCPKCYAAMTDEAVEMVMERLEVLHDNCT